MVDKNEKTNPSPLIISIITAFSGLIGTGIGAAAISSFADERLERQKFEYTLIQEALEAESQNEVLANLQFLLEMGMIQTLDQEKLEELIQKPERLEQLKNLPTAVQQTRTLLLNNDEVEAIEVSEEAEETIRPRLVRPE
ncbi:hypothetical protein Lepto7376_1879 [[Leptolyngbya] sp. PCC 7376]|uniref:hypothetical protein n=1 Tax=[Leptolyngbya] sp. PCC 7376 TaxID=111781 RepID=UPI00029F0D74|nr:hypothetical protein [[Leptolyngbya] sp. PCC 7376]AFY38199.1 hypothetical protein Lepto7376_1879 [[Leptolyngbya] sp. PCC 7376]